METEIYNDSDFSLIDKGAFTTLYYNRKLELALCIAETEYIPIDNFKEVFFKISELIIDYPISHLIFDKRNLRTFHQPSMEWYFAIWKPLIKNKGLTNHYKILPKLDWFEKAVMAGKQEIFKKYSGSLLSGIHVTYCNSIEEVIDLVKKNMPADV